MPSSIPGDQEVLYMVTVALRLLVILRNPRPSRAESYSTLAPNRMKNAAARTTWALRLPVDLAMPLEMNQPWRYVRWEGALRHELVRPAKGFEDFPHHVLQQG